MLTLNLGINGGEWSMNSLLSGPHSLSGRYVKKVKQSRYRPEVAQRIPGS